MGDCQNGELRVDFDGRLKLRFVGSQVTTDAGLLVPRTRRGAGTDRDGCRQPARLSPGPEQAAWPCTAAPSVDLQPTGRL